MSTTEEAVSTAINRTAVSLDGVLANNMMPFLQPIGMVTRVLKITSRCGNHWFLVVLHQSADGTVTKGHGHRASVNPAYGADFSMVYSRGEPHCRQSTFVNGERVQEALPEYERRFAAHRRESSVVTCVLECRDEGDEALTLMRATIVFTQGHHPRLDVVAWTVETFPKVGQEDDDDPGGRYLYADGPSEVHTLNDGWTHEWIDPATSAAVALPPLLPTRGVVEVCSMLGGGLSPYLRTRRRAVRISVLFF